MENLEVRTRNKNSHRFDYKGNLQNVLVFLKNSLDQINIIQGTETVNIEIYDDGKCLFSGDKYELFEKLKS